jgi:arginyl-tRNA synthetase
MVIPQTEGALQRAAAESVKALFGLDVDPATLVINATPREYRGQYTLVVFPLVKALRKAPEEIGALLGAELQARLPYVRACNTVKGFLNLELSDAHWLSFLDQALDGDRFGCHPPSGQVVVLEYCGPNTNKPLHLGHVRNMLLGWSVAELLSAAGHAVHKVNMYNDRGIAICKSMAAYRAVGQDKTPQSEGVKGDHFVGSFYVAYNRLATEQSQAWLDQGMERREAEKQTAIYADAHDLLLRWEAGDEGVRALWARMNGWVYEGFQQTFTALGVDFERDYLESATYLEGVRLVQEGLESGVFTRHEDGSVRVDLSADGLDEKVLLRSDGSSMYITQDLGTAELRYRDYRMDRSVYVVGSEQEYHFQVLALLLQKLGRPYAEGLYHLSYGMVDLPSGKMKSREGTTVDADDLIRDMVATAREKTLELGKIEGFGEQEAEELFRILGLGALKFFLLKVDPRKRILFNPAESIELQGHTGPFVQYSYARIRSMQRKAAERGLEPQATGAELTALDEQEIALLALLERYPSVVREAARRYSPAEVANYAYELAKAFNQFYDKLPVLQAGPAERRLRLRISELVARTLKSSLGLLGIEVPERM